MTFDRQRAVRNLPLAIAICFGIDVFQVAVRGLPLADIIAFPAVGANLAIAAVIAALSGVNVKGRRA